MVGTTSINTNTNLSSQSESLISASTSSTSGVSCQLRTSNLTTSRSKMSLNMLPAAETKSGCLVLVMGARRQRLQVKIYGKTMDPFAAFYPDKKHCRHCGVMKLRGCRVEPVKESDTDFRVIPTSTDGGKMLVFGAETSTERDVWLEAFSSNTVARDINGRARSISLNQFRMPSLPEMEEEACSDSSDYDCEHDESSSQNGTPKRLPKSRHHFLQNLDQYGCRPRCITHPVIHHEYHGRATFMGRVGGRDYIPKC